MRLRGVPLAALLEAGVRLVALRRGDAKTQLAPMLEQVPGRDVMTADERTVAMGTDAALRRLGVSCLWRAAVITSMLRRRGIGAHVRLSMSPTRRGVAHAEVEVAGSPLHAEEPGAVVLR